MLSDLRVYEDLTVFVSTIGDKLNFQDCMTHLRDQSVRFPIEIIDRVAPMSAAFQRMQDLCRTDFYVQVDEDMILFSHAIKTLRSLMHSAPKNVAIICAPLWDCDAERAIYGVKIYRTSIVKRFAYKNVMNCEVEQLDRIKAAGYEIGLQPLSRRSACLGEHGKHYTPKTIFKRWQRCFQKHHRYGNMAWVEPYARSLLDRYVASGETVHLYAFLGVISGIVGPPPDDREQDWRESNLAYEQITRYFAVNS